MVVSQDSKHSSVPITVLTLSSYKSVYLFWMEPVLRAIVSEGKRACLFTESKMIPKYSSRERGMFNLLN